MLSCAEDFEKIKSEPSGAADYMFEQAKREAEMEEQDQGEISGKGAPLSSMPPPGLSTGVDPLHDVLNDDGHDLAFTKLDGSDDAADLSKVAQAPAQPIAE